jgi:Ca2+-binding EF-hand superfamily protein
MKKAIWFLVILASLAFASTSFAYKEYAGHFGDMDTDGDEAVTIEEFKTFLPNATEEAFTIIDKDKSGALSHDEWEAFKESHKMGQGMGHGMKKGKGHGMGEGYVHPPCEEGEVNSTK